LRLGFFILANQLCERQVWRASLARRERDQAGDRDVAMLVDRAQVNLTDNVTART